MRPTSLKKVDYKVMRLVDVLDRNIFWLLFMSVLFILVICICMYIYCYIAISRFFSISNVLLFL